MSYNPERFDTPYGFSLLDELHNFFPELMYDDSLFRDDYLPWIRHRVQALFPEFTRQQSLYRLYAATRRRTLFDSFMAEQRRSNPAVVVTVPLVETPNRPIHVVTPTGPRRVQRRTILSNLQNVIDVDDTMTDFVNLLMQDVPVVPTNQQIESNSRIVADINPDELCSICQAHAHENDNSTWRRLNCEHVFHNRCILTWFRRDVHCPVCRSDIRTPVTH
jgi:hypothetical protein